MAETNVDQVRERLESRITELQRAQKQLQKPSTISFVERRDLSARAAKAVTELREHQAALEGEAEGDEAQAGRLTEAEAALERAESVLSSAGMGQGGGPKRTAGASDRRMQGQGPRGATGSSQQRSPNRSGGE